MPPKVEPEEESPESAFFGRPDVAGQMYRWTLPDDLSGRHDMHANAATAQAAGFLMQLSTSANCAMLLIGIVRMLQVGGLSLSYIFLPPISVLISCSAVGI